MKPEVQQSSRLSDHSRGEDLARVLAHGLLARCDLGPAEIEACKHALPRETWQALEAYLDGEAPTPPASLLVPPSESTGESFSTKCAAVLASLGTAPRWMAAAVLAMVLGVTAWLVFGPNPSNHRDGSDWASALVAAIPAERLEMWGRSDEPRSLTRRLEPPGGFDLSSRLDPRVVAVALPHGGFQTGAAIGPNLVLTLSSGVEAESWKVFDYDLEQGWLERVGQVRTLFPGLGLVTLVVDGTEFEVWFDLAEEAEDALLTNPAAAEPRDVWVIACGFGGTEGGVLWSPEGPAAVLDGDRIATDIGMRAGLGGSPILTRAGDLLGIVVGSQAGGRFAVGLSKGAVRQQLFSEAGALRGVNGVGEG